MTSALFWIPVTEAGYDIGMPHSVTYRIIMLLALLLAGGTVHAAGYNVEVILFENLRPATDGEIAQTSVAYPDFSGALEPGEEKGNPFRLLSSGLYKLGGIYNQLQASGKYRPFLHVAWQQPALSGNSAQAVHIRKAVPAVADGTENNLVKIDGMVRVRAAQFLHTDVDLLYFPQAMPLSEIQPVAGNVIPAAVPSGYSRLRETRRMKLNELHYFDHPLFGMIVHISRAGAE